MKPHGTIALRLCQRGMDDKLTSSEVKLATWLIAAADRLGGFPVQFSLREIQNGCERNGVAIAGWSAHHNTIRAALDGLEEKQIIINADGAKKQYGHVSRLLNPHHSLLS